MCRNHLIAFRDWVIGLIVISILSFAIAELILKKPFAVWSTYFYVLLIMWTVAKVFIFLIMNKK